MGRLIETDCCVIGAGSGGLSVAAGAAQLGVRVVLVEKGAMGGDCLNTGCVPSKSLLAAGRAARAVGGRPGLGVAGGPGAGLDFAAVMAHVHATIAAIAPHDSQARFEGLGVTVLRHAGTFEDDRTLRVGDDRVRARWFVIATGSAPALPPVPGLAEVAPLTTDSVWSLRDLPRRLIVLGGGPVAAELGQGYARLGAEVVVLARSRLLGREDDDLAAVVAERLRAEGIDLREGAVVAGVARSGDGVRVVLGDGSAVEGSHLLVATGRRPALAGLGLEAAGVATGGATGGAGIVVDKALRTTNRRIFAVGDVVGQGQFTHLAAHHAATVVRAMLFRLPADAGRAAVPRVTYTDPELAQVGLTEAEARARHGAGVQVLTESLAALDRGRCDGLEAGLAKVVLDRRGRVLGAGLVGPGAGDLLAPWVLAVDGAVSLRRLATQVAAYPTLGEVTKRIAGRYYGAALFAPRTRALVRLLMRFAPSLSSRP